MKHKYWLLLIAILSFIVVIFNEILFANVPELFPFGDESGQVLSNLCLAIISSYIFYLILVIPKENRDKKNIYSSIYGLTRELIGRGNEIYNFILSGSGEDKENFDLNTISREDFKKLCTKFRTIDIVAGRMLGIGNQATYGAFVYNDAYKHVKNYMEKIFVYMPFLDSDYLKIINSLNSTEFFLVADNLVSPYFGNQDFSSYADGMYDFLQIIRELESFNETKIRSYVK